MSFDVPDDRRYLETHEWADRDGDVVRVGITDFAQDELGDVVFVDLPHVGDDVTQEKAFGVVESIKAVSDVYAPVGGVVVDRNQSVIDQPELINEDPFGEGWMIEIELLVPEEFDELLTAEEYERQIE